MTTESYDLDSFVHDMRSVTREESDDKGILRRMVPLARKFAADPSWRDRKFYEADPEQGMGFHLLHEEPDHTLAVFAICWLPGRGVGPHNHKSWSIVVGVDGAETNTFWKRLDDGTRPGHAELERAAERPIGEGEVVALDGEEIHSVQNVGDTVSLSLHVYGKHLNHSGRSLFDPEKQTEERLIVRIAD
jgi:predicted metal-dependent enzyme (double-stranded beta helix superfamily)